MTTAPSTSNEKLLYGTLAHVTTILTAIHEGRQYPAEDLSVTVSHCREVLENTRPVVPAPAIAKPYPR